jgi:uncharacterized phage infection (PIP) family protein YhgE
MKTRAILLVVVCLLLVPAAAQSSGIPVYDASNMINQIRDYLQQIKYYQEALNQGTTLTSQYLQMIRDYQQVLRQYQHYLNQIQSVRHMISDQDWLRLMRTINYYTGKCKRAVIVESDPYSSTYEDDMNTVLSQYGHVPRHPSEVEADARSLGIWSDQYEREVREDWERYEFMKDRLRIVSNNDKQSKDRIERVLPGHADVLNNLGDESDLATMQAMAAQNQTLLNQMESSIQIQNQILFHMESEQARRAAVSAKWREAERQRLKNRKPTQLLGRDRWGHF